MLWGSHYPDAPKIFLNDSDLVSQWGTGNRKFLVVPEESETHVAGLIAGHAWLIDELSTHRLLTDRPLELASGHQAPELAGLLSQHANH
jgi:hypothetical protein